MKKTLKMCAFFAFVLLSVLTFGRANVYAAEPLTLTQADFDYAKDNPNVDTKKMKYVTSSGSSTTVNYYILTADNYVLGENIDIGTASIGITKLAGDNITFDLANYTIENATTDEYNAARVLDEGVIIIQNVSTNFKGTGSIKYNGDYIAAMTFTDENGTEKQNLSGITVNGQIEFYDTSVVIDGINSKTVNFKNCDVVINGGTFKGELTSGVYFFYENGTYSLTVNGGTFISDGDNGIEITNLAGNPSQYADIVINGGTFKGGMSGITIDNFNSLSINGGVFEYTNIDDGRGPIAIYGKKLDEVKDIISSKLNSGNVISKNDGYSDYVSIDVVKATFGTSTGSNDNETTVVVGNNNEKDDTPKTGNYSNFALFFILFVGSLSGIICFSKKGFVKVNKNVG